MSNLYNKYIVTKTDGSPVDPNAQYFVLRIDTDPEARKALLHYSSLISQDDPEFANELAKWVLPYLMEDKDKTIWETSHGQKFIVLDGEVPSENDMKYHGLKLAAENLLSQLKATYESPEYQAVWVQWYFRNGQYTGPNWIVEQDALRAELDKLK